jgi:hypothetical protein
MKKIKYIFILLLLFSIKITAQQQYRSCLDGEMIKWSVLTEIFDWPQFSIEIIAYGDTVINETAYKKVMEKELSGFAFEESNTNWRNYIPDLSNETPDHYIRESDDASQLYIFFWDNREYLITDLNLQVGDEFPVPEIWRSLIYESSLTVDSVYTENGLKHVRLDHTFQVWDLESGQVEHSLTFIEGIGPNIGPFIVWCDLPPIVNCFQNRSLFYKNELISYPCGYKGQVDAIQTVSSNDDYVLQLEDNQIKIHFSKAENRQISIYDISGRLQYDQSLFPQKELIIPIALFPKGIYLLKIYSKDNNQINVYKIIL